MAGKKKMPSNYGLGAASGTLGSRASGTNLALGSLRGSMNGATRQSRIDSYLGGVTGEKPKGKKKGR